MFEMEEWLKKDQGVRINQQTFDRLRWSRSWEDTENDNIKLLSGIFPLQKFLPGNRVELYLVPTLKPDRRICLPVE